MGLSQSLWVEASAFNVSRKWMSEGSVGVLDLVCYVQ